MDRNIKRGMLRVWVLVSVLWIGGMGWYQYNAINEDKKNSFTFAISKDAQFRIDANGISQNNDDDKNLIQMKHIGIILLPPLLLLMMFPICSWLASGFKPK